MRLSSVNPMILFSLLVVTLSCGCAVCAGILFTICPYEGTDVLKRMTLSGPNTTVEIKFEPKHHGFEFTMDACYDRTNILVKAYVTNLSTNTVDIGWPRPKPGESWDNYPGTTVKPKERAVWYEGPLQPFGISSRRAGRPTTTLLRLEFEFTPPLQEDIPARIKAPWGTNL